MKIKKIHYKFVDLIPNDLEYGVIYISIKYSTAIHKCMCGCGNEVVIPISPNDWQLLFDGETVSLYPSIGNWNFRCRSHYWIVNNKIIFHRKSLFKFLRKKVIITISGENAGKNKNPITDNQVIGFKKRGPTWARTKDPLIMSQVL